MRVAIAGYNNFQCNLLGKIVSEPESLPGSQEGGSRSYQEFYRVGSHKRCVPPSPHFTRQLNGVEWGLKKLDFLLPAASVLTVVLPFAVLVCGDGDQVAETLSLKGHLGFGIHRCAFGVIIPVPAQVVAHYHSNCGGGVLRDL